MIPEQNMYLVASQPGLPSLELANRLHGSGNGVIYANPNWADVRFRR